MLKGGYPALHTQPVETADWFASYIATYVERDVRQVLNIQSLPTFQCFLRLCAGRAGQLLNVAALASEAGITANTAKSWLAVLESSDLMHLLPPYFRNFGKRLVKMPKLYFHDTGLACWLHGNRSEEVLALHPLCGALFENWVVGESGQTITSDTVRAGQRATRMADGVASGLYFCQQRSKLISLK